MLPAFRDRRFRAHVRRVAPCVLDAEKQARTVELEAEFDETGAALLLPGYSADVEVILDERAYVLRIPTRALLEGRRVYVLEDGRVHAREVATGLGTWEYTEITVRSTKGRTLTLGAPPCHERSASAMVGVCTMRVSTRYLRTRLTWRSEARRTAVRALNADSGLRPRQLRFCWKTSTRAACGGSGGRPWKHSTVSPRRPRRHSCHSAARRASARGATQ